MSTDSQIIVIGIGSPLIDSLTHVSEEFLVDVPGDKGGMELVEIHHIEGLVERSENNIVHASGGSAANTILGLSQLGMRCTFLGKLGNDKHAEFYAENLSDAGVCTRRFKYSDVHPTGRCLSMITPDSQRTCRTHLGAAMTLAPEEIEVEDFSECTHAHIEGYKLFNRALALRILQCAKEAGCSISLDLASFEVVRSNLDILDEILDDYIDIVFANEDEAQAYCDFNDPLVGLNKLAEHCEVAAVKLGADGAYIQRGNDVVKVDAPSVDAVDTTGAGDLWAAGFLYGYHQGYDLRLCGLAGSILGSTVVQQTGAAIPSEHWPSIRERVFGLSP